MRFSEDDAKELQANIDRGKNKPGSNAKGPPSETMPKKNKYGAEKETVDNIVFDSKKEAGRYQELKLLQQAGLIFGLKLQPKFSIDINEIHVCNYFADFEYLDENACRVVEDTKGFRTPVYKLKKRLVEAIYGIEIVEV